MYTHELLMKQWDLDNGRKEISEMIRKWTTPKGDED
jgi:hypothetical protein